MQHAPRWAFWGGVARHLGAELLSLVAPSRSIWGCGDFVWLAAVCSLLSVWLPLVAGLFVFVSAPLLSAGLTNYVNAPVGGGLKKARFPKPPASITT